MNTPPIFLIALLTFTLHAHAGHDHAVEAADLPAAVTKVLNEKYPNARTLKAKREDKKNRVKYEVNLCHEGREIEVELSADGHVEEVEHEGAC